MIKQMQLKKFLKKYPFAAQLLPVQMDTSDDRYYVRFSSDLLLIEFGYLSDKWSLPLSD